MKKKVLSIVAVALVAILIVAGVIVYQKVPMPLSYDIDSIESVGTDVEVVSKTEDTVTIKKSFENDFKVMMFTDIHLDGKNKTSKVTVSNIVKNVQREKPDLIILGGDSVTSAYNEKRSHQLAQIFEKLGVYWAGVLGNHEGDNKYSITREEMVDIFTSYEHCLMLKGLEDVEGNCNYALNLLNQDGKLRQTFYFLDTFDEYSEEQKQQYESAGYELVKPESDYDGVKESQILWYQSKLNEVRNEYGNHNSIMVIHIPVPQYYKAVQEGLIFDYGQNLEGVCCSAYDSGLFTAVKNSQSTTAIFCGHDHLNNSTVNYEGILLNYMEPSGYGSYGAKKLGYEEKDWLQGYTLLKLNNSEEFSIERFRNSEFAE